MCECVGVWVCGCVDVWMCGCVCVCVWEHFRLFKLFAVVYRYHQQLEQLLLLQPPQPH